MIVFGSELRYHSRLKDVRLRPLIPVMRLFYQIFGLFGFYGGGEYLRSLYFRRILKRHRFKFDSL